MGQLNIVEKSSAAFRRQRVKEYEILRARAQLPDEEDAVKEARSSVLRWAQARSGWHFPQEAWEFKDFEHYSGGRNSIGVRIQSDESDIWALRADDPDKYVPGRAWTTEVVIGIMKGQLPRFSTRLLCYTKEDELNISPHTPNFVFNIAQSQGLYLDGKRLQAGAEYISSDIEAEFFIDRLLDSGRKLPIFVLTTPDNSISIDPLLDAEKLARACMGTAEIVVLPAQYTWRLTERVHKERSVFNGSVRAYLPGFSEDANPYLHRLVLNQYLGNTGQVEQCQRWLRSLAAMESVRNTPLGRDVLSFADVRNASFKEAQDRLEHEGASDAEKLAAARSRIAALEQQYEQAKAAQDYFDSEHKVAEERAEAAEEQARASAFRIQQLLTQINDSGNATNGQDLFPTCWDDFVSWCDTALAGRVTLAPRARKGIRSPLFEDPTLAARCLNWLATAARDRRIAGGDGSLGEEYIESGIKNTHCGSDQFDLLWQGQLHTADWHIKNGGNTREPRRCLRIYYFWDSASQQIVVADMPAHRVTGAS
jgi:hypothetical protein